MNYRDTLHAIDTLKALELLGIQTENRGAYLKFPCPHCNEPALFKTYGDKKNLWCPKCKKGGNLIKFTMEFKNLQWEPAKELLSKAIGTEAKTITEPLNITCVLEYPKFHTSFNPESYLYNYHRIDKANDLVVCTDLFLCIKSLVEGKPAVSTFGLPYLSQKQLELLNQCKMLTVFRADTEIVRQISAHYNGYVRFIG